MLFIFQLDVVRYAFYEIKWMKVWPVKMSVEILINCFKIDCLTSNGYLPICLLNNEFQIKFKQRTFFKRKFAFMPSTHTHTHTIRIYRTLYRKARSKLYLRMGNFQEIECALEFIYVFFDIHFEFVFIKLTKALTWF